MAVQECIYSGGGISLEGKTLQQMFTGARSLVNSAETLLCTRNSGTYWTTTPDALNFSEGYLTSVRNSNTLTITAKSKCLIQLCVDNVVNAPKWYDANEQIYTWSFYGDDDAQISILAFTE